MKLPRYIRQIGLGAAGSLLVALATAGCGGGGGGSSAPQQVNYAPSTLNGRTLVFQDPTLQAVSTAFAYTQGGYTTAADSGSYTYGRDAQLHQATLVNNSTTTTITSTYRLQFLNGTGGNYTKTQAAQGGGTLTESSTFTIQ